MISAPFSVKIPSKRSTTAFFSSSSMFGRMMYIISYFLAIYSTPPCGLKRL
ncbi:30S ribosomal protein S6 [Listeria monocytogenes]|nr:30S ribosomal protein S6 [Listeria monocytogenes]